MTDLVKLFEEFKNIRAGVIGDVMLDTYWWGHVERISPEAPVPVVSLDKREYRIGGAGNVAINLASLGAEVSVFSVIGQDDEGNIVKELLEKKGIRTGDISKNEARITTNKARIISRNQQMMRLDSETTRDISEEDEKGIIQRIENYIAQKKPQVIIFEDYNKGVLTERVITEVIALCKKKEVLTAADPKKKHFFLYKGVDIFKPNLKEVREGLNLLLNEINLPALRNIHQLLSEKLGHRISFITLSEKGVFCQQEELARIIPSYVRSIADVSGAGDTVIAVASLVYAVTKDPNLMSEIANIAGGLVCEEVGTVAIDKGRLLERCRLLLDKF
ncbi:MAG TPA: PfkB family carbohydrate kinase [Puia sp.]|nr:PfkB family carbohydrate kinase [Puia sp.]